MNFVVIDSGVRLDLTLSHAFAGLSRAQAKTLLTARGVRVGGKITTSAGLRMSAGEVIDIDVAALDTRSAEARAGLAKKENDIVVLAEGPGWSALRKPAGLPSVAGFFGDKLHFAAMACRRIGGDAALADFGLLHRLDNDTSGTSLIARDAASYAILRAARDDGGLARTYWAIVLGAPAASGVVDTPIAHHPSDAARMIVVTEESVAHRAKPQPAQSDYVVLARAEDRALVAVKIHGGRRHQIRVHLSSIGHPVLGDSLYGDFSAVADATAWPKRFALHAMALDFVAPGGGAEHVVSEPGDHFWQFAPALRRAIT